MAPLVPLILDPSLFCFSSSSSTDPPAPKLAGCSWKALPLFHRPRPERLFTVSSPPPPSSQVFFPFCAGSYTSVLFLKSLEAAFGCGIVFPISASFKVSFDVFLSLSPPLEQSVCFSSFPPRTHDEPSARRDTPVVLPFPKETPSSSAGRQCEHHLLSLFFQDNITLSLRISQIGAATAAILLFSEYACPLFFVDRSTGMRFWLS